MTHKAPEKAHREGIALLQLLEMFPTEESAHDWFVEQRWSRTGRPRCGCMETTDKGGVMAFWCPDCRRRFSVRMGTPMERSRIPLRKWVVAIYLSVTSLEGVSSMKRDLGITQKSAWFMAHRIREAMLGESGGFLGPAEADETYMGGQTEEHVEHEAERANRSRHHREDGSCRREGPRQQQGRRPRHGGDGCNGATGLRAGECRAGREALHR